VPRGPHASAPRDVAATPVYTRGVPRRALLPHALTPAAVAALAALTALAGLAALACGCHAPDAPPSQPPVATVAVASAEPALLPPATTAAAPAAPAGPCDAVLAANAKLLAAHVGFEPESEVPLSEACFPTPSGAWVLRLDSWENNDSGGDGMENFSFTGRFTAVHLPDGAERTIELPELSRGFASSTIRKPALFDHDGDGEPELFLVVTTHNHESASQTRAALYTWKPQGGVLPYPGLPDDVEEREDVDGDGRPDYLYFPHGQERISPCSGFDFRWSGPALVAHSLPGGGFSLDDAAARAHLLRTCPLPRGPARAAPSADCDHCPGSDCNLCPGITAPPELCARLHGESERAALALLARTCKRPANPDQECTPPKGVCGDYADREAAVKAAEPAPGAAKPGRAAPASPGKRPRSPRPPAPAPRAPATP
jgi:hypothetical protein